MAEKGRSGRKIEGEGSREADRRYREGVTDHLRKGHVEEEGLARGARGRGAAGGLPPRRGGRKKRSAGNLPEDLER